MVGMADNNVPTTILNIIIYFNSMATSLAK
jgi:hypothetical protein